MGGGWRREKRGGTPKGGGFVREQKCEGRKEGWGERDKLKKRKRACERERERESEVVSGGGGCWSVEMSVAH